MAKHILVKGVAQGVGLRPYVYGLATRLNLHGWVSDTSGGVEILVQGPSADIDNFIRSLSSDESLRSFIDDLRVLEETSEVEYKTFDMRPSMARHASFESIPTDIAICPDCERELFDPRSRRYLYPFTNCNHCGPRFTILRELPYVRANTTMGEFTMCARCEAEYNNPLSRRYHAPPIACPDCGPFVALREIHSQFPNPVTKISSIECRTSAILKARRLLRDGYILGIKSIGGFYLACDASNSLTVEELRDRKGCPDKPFAVMASDLEVVRSICRLNSAEQALLTGRENPVVLLERKQQSEEIYKVSRWVAPNLDTLGLMLPYTPLHHLLLNQTDPLLVTEPVPPLLVMTSANFPNGPIATDDEDVLLRLAPLVDAFVIHNREIQMRCDDSLVKVDRGSWTRGEEEKAVVDHPSSTIYLRRSRGYAPFMVELPFEVKPILAVGGELSNTFCLTRDRTAFVSHHIGDMEDAETDGSFEQGIECLSRLYQVQPERIAHDLHPGYFSTKYARRVNAACFGVQHHHAHLVSCMVDNSLDDRRRIGLAFDRTGYGSDNAVWGGEVLLASFADFERFAHLEYLPLPGLDSASRSPWRIAVAYAHVLGIEVEDLPFLRRVPAQALQTLRQEIGQNINNSQTSSMGYLFDAVASLIGLRNEVTYESQASIEMEGLAKPFVTLAKAYPFTIDDDGIIHLSDLLKAICRDVRAASSVEIIAARFHKTLADIAVEICQRARQARDLNEVVLSGDLWQNQALLELVREGLRREGFLVYFHRQIPTNDGGLSLGQAIVANFQTSH